MSKYHDNLKYILVNQKYISAQEYKDAFTNAKKQDKTVVDYLIENNLLTKDILGQAAAEAYKIPYSDLNSNRPDGEQIFKINKELAQTKRIVIFKDDKDKKELTITTDLPLQKNLKTDLKEIFPDKKIKITFSLSEDIDDILILYRDPIQNRINEIIEDGENVASRIIDEVFKDALINKVSDIHVEPRSSNVHIRLRIDGVLEDIGTIPNDVYGAVVNRFKVLSKLRIDEHFSAQDGSVRYSLGDRYIDARISIVPTLYGEKIVARVLATYVKSIDLKGLGIGPDDIKILEEAAKKPFGMIVNVGPTGSGKTTTLYSIIRLLNKPGVNITTIEDPVEYRVDGINQIQVDKDRNLDFARGLRSIVRQDPDIILVGEIRDEETAEISVNAALTGHLMLSTFHANDAATAIPRLLDMGIEPFLLASTLELVVAQRLVRKVCENCKYSKDINVSEAKKQMSGYKIPGKSKKITVYEGKGCNVCGHSGYNGRTAIFEYIKASSAIKDLILKNPSTDEVWDLAKKEGSKSLFDDGFEKVKSGETTIEELVRVAKPPEYEK